MSASRLLREASKIVNPSFEEPPRPLDVRERYSASSFLVAAICMSFLAASSWRSGCFWDNMPALRSWKGSRTVLRFSRQSTGFWATCAVFRLSSWYEAAHVIKRHGSQASKRQSLQLINMKIGCVLKSVRIRFLVISCRVRGSLLESLTHI